MTTAIGRDDIDNADDFDESGWAAATMRGPPLAELRKGPQNFGARVGKPNPSP